MNLLPYKSQDLVVQRENQLTGTHMTATPDVKHYFPMSLWEFASICFMRVFSIVPAIEFFNQVVLNNTLAQWQSWGQESLKTKSRKAQVEKNINLEPFEGIFIM